LEKLVSLAEKQLQIAIFSTPVKPSTHIDENAELTIGVSERQIRG